MPQQIHVEDGQFHKRFRAASNIDQHRSKQCYTIYKSDHILIFYIFQSFSLYFYDDDYNWNWNWNWKWNLRDYVIIDHISFYL